MPSEESMGRAGAELLAQRLSGVRHQKWLAELLDSVRLEEAEWWSRNATEGHISDEALARLADLRLGAGR